jgi:hypothetical protein
MGWREYRRVYEAVFFRPGALLVIQFMRVL